MPSRKQTIKMFAHELLVEPNFIDIHGRAVGHDYDFILARIREQFPNARTTRRLLQDMAYIFNRTERLPVRRRSRRALAEDYASAMLLRRSGVHAHRGVQTLVRKKFPEQRMSSVDLRRLDTHLRHLGFPVPPRSLVA